MRTSTVLKQMLTVLLLDLQGWTNLHNLLYHYAGAMEETASDLFQFLTTAGSLLKVGAKVYSPGPQICNLFTRPLPVFSSLCLKLAYRQGNKEASKSLL
jgi:hypothetical protein